MKYHLYVVAESNLRLTLHFSNSVHCVITDVVVLFSIRVIDIDCKLVKICFTLSQILTILLGLCFATCDILPAVMLPILRNCSPVILAKLYKVLCL